MKKRSFIRSVGAVLAGVVLVIAFLAGAILLYGLIHYFLFDARAEAKATVLCEGTAIGSPAGLALERAKRAGSATSEPIWVEGKDGERLLEVVFPDNDPRSGYYCRIYARDGKVTRVEIPWYIID